MAILQGGDSMQAKIERRQKVYQFGDLAFWLLLPVFGDFRKEVVCKELLQRFGGQIKANIVWACI
jgi:hypothetical protein